ncbi:alpha/beta fold hydrolase [Nocardioides sp. HM23]|uniref:esterase/lipase family protein n=1 Tax=Nocardioides bizhenqiangii TaxID=3095076 RepID=UPI002ACAC131|nr:alpha/beta fold hydrolase [Nocardioides sp. HM23]MDZ5619433.1 alpha/beta fold hydrolase [Nocardioides sp. HM23]
MRRRHAVIAALVAVTALLGATGGVVTAPVGHAEDGGSGDLPVSYNFLLSAVTAGAKVDADPPGGNDWSCRPTARHPRPVVLVHGTAGNKNSNWQTYSPLLANEGYCVFALTYGVPPGAPPIQDQLGGITAMQSSARQLKAFVARVLRATGASKVDIVGHSQGTLIPEYYVKFLGGAKHVKRYISLAPLWHGTTIANYYRLLAKVFGVPEDQIPLCQACGQYAATSDFMRRLRAGGLVVGDIEYTNIMTKYDQLVVPYSSGREPGMRNVVVQDHCRTDYSEHFEIAADPVAARIVLNTLDPAHKRPVPCMVVLPFIGPVGGP